MYQGFKKALTIGGAALGFWLLVHFFLPVSLPFLLGGALALVAEPMVALLSGKLKLRRGLAAAFGVTMAFCLLLLLMILLCALILRQLGALVSVLPSLEESLAGGLSSLSAWALDLAARLPGGMGNLLSQSLRDFFSGSSQLLQQSFRFALGLTGGVLRQVPGGALVLGTAVISSYMISARLPKIQAWCRAKVPGERIRKLLAQLRQLKAVVFGWLKAQAKLMGVTFLILTLGLMLLRVPHALLWAGAVALVDAFPVLGTGTVLLPWALVSVLQGQTVRAVGLLGIYAAVSLTRSVLEPKLLGSHLGLDPLATLAALYAGYRFWGFGGMLIAPLLAVTAVQLLRESNPKT